MYQFLGDTGIQMCDLFNKIAAALVFLFNFLYFRQKKQMLSKCSEFFINSPSKKKYLSIFKNATICTIAEILLISFNQQYTSGIFGPVLAEFAGTGSNYFSVLFFVPLFLLPTLLVISVNPLKQMDMITPAFPLSLIFLKLACFFQGCCNGIECEGGLYNHDTGLTEFPVQLVEAGLALLIFIFLILWKKRAKEGTMFPLYMILYSATRFFSEFLRAEENVLGFLKVYHILCILGVILGIIELNIIKKKRERIIEIYDKSFFIVLDFFNVVLEGFELKKEKRITHRKNKRTNSNTPKKRQRYSDVQFDFSKLRIWILVWLLGLIGQIGWNVESSWFNTFIYEKIDKNPSIITPMLILSALATAVSIFIFGTLSDRTGKRRNFINIGYIFWGLLLMSFGLTQFLARNYFSFAIVCIIVGDMFISLFASMGTDVGFGTWLADIMNEKNAGQIGAAIAAQSVLGALMGTIVGGLLIGSQNNYIKMFFVMGAMLIVAGIIASYLFNKKDDVIPKIKGSLKEQLTVGFNYKGFFKHKELLWVHISIAIFFTGYNTYYPHLGNYLIDYLGFSAEQMGVIGAIPLVLAMIVTVPTTKLINENKFFQITALSVFSGLLGVLFIYPLTPESVNTSRVFNPRLLLGVFLIGVSFITMLQATKVWTKKMYPQGSKGQFEIFGSIAYGLIPVTFGSTVGEKLVKYTGLVSFNEATERVEYIPTGSIFLIGAIISAFTFIPIIITKKYSDKKSKETIDTQ